MTSARTATARDGERISSADRYGTVPRGIDQQRQRDAKHAPGEQHDAQTHRAAFYQVQQGLRYSYHPCQFRLPDPKSYAPGTQHSACRRQHQALPRPLGQRTLSLVRARHADNVAVMAKPRKRPQAGPATRTRADNAPGKMDYVQSRKRAAPISPVVDRGGNTGQVKDRSSGARNSGVSRDADDPTDKQLIAVRREIHNRLGRLQKLQATVTQLLTSLAELEVRERSLVFDLWAAAPSRLAEINDSTRRWRRRRTDT